MKKKFVPHYMYNIKTGIKKIANTFTKHTYLKKRGYKHIN